MSDTVTDAPSTAPVPPASPLIQLLEQPDADVCCGGGTCGI